MSKRIVFGGLFITLIIVLSCSERDLICECEPPFEEPEYHESMEDSIVRVNCDILRDAIEAFAIGNFGEYPHSVEEDYIYKTYDNLKDYLPERQLLWNPYTLERLEPSVEVAGVPGEIGFLPIMDDDYCVGYYITGYGQDSIIVELVDTLSAEERAVIDNCILLRDAAEAYAFDNFDEFPRTLTALGNDSGKVYLDYLPSGERLQNPYTGESDEPSCFYSEQPDAPGEIGYSYYYETGFYLGYEIVGFGDDTVKCRISNARDQQDIQVIANCYLVRWAAESFAAENSGIYPKDVSIDTNSLGYTLKDYLVNGRLLQNPYTMVCSEPIDGTAVNPGQTGYTPVNQDGWIVGYVITGVGQDSGITIVTLYKPRDM